MADIREVQLAGLEILKEVVKVCEKHSIKYYLSSGTLLGAVRHKGFIPWDNDVDIEMPIEDYKKFLRIAPRELPEKYFVQTYISDLGYNEMWAKVRMNGITSLPVAWKKLNTHWGIGIDVFPVIGVYENARLQKIQSKMFGIARTLIAKEFIMAVNPEEVTKSKKLKLLYIMPRCMRTCLCKVLESFVFKSCRSSKRVVLVYTALSNYLINEKYNKECKLKFEDNLFCVPENYDYILKTYYGDYMTPPPIEERNGHEGSLGKIIYDCKKDFTYYM